MPDFLTDVTTLRERARAQLDQGPITEAYGADRERVIDVLNQVLATELVCVLRYKRHFYTAKGLDAGPVAAEFQQHANEEMQHADRRPLFMAFNLFHEAAIAMERSNARYHPYSEEAADPPAM